MEDLKKEFESYLKEIIESYPKATETLRDNPSGIKDVGEKSRDFNAKCQAKIKEMAIANKIPELNLKASFAPIIVRYSGLLLRGHL